MYKLLLVTSFLINHMNISVLDVELFYRFAIKSQVTLYQNYASDNYNKIIRIDTIAAFHFCHYKIK